MHDLIFDELPGARTREQQVNKLLKDVYRIRSKHFHAGEFAAGELEPWEPVGILQPTTVAMRETFSRMNALVNGLLVAWLVKRGTDNVWRRAAEAFPEWKEHQTFSTSVKMCGAAQDSE